MPVDPDILLQAKPFDVAKVAQGANALMQMQQNRQQIEGQNALRQVFADPSSLDDSGMPTADAMNKIMAIDPNTGMQIRQNMLSQQEKLLQIEGTKTTNYGKKLDLAHEKSDAALTAYEESVKRGMPEQQAREQAQKVYTDGYDDLKKSGLYSEAEISSLNPQFDPTRARSNAMSYKEWKDREDKQDKEKRAEKHQTFEEGIQSADLGLARSREGREAAKFKEEQAGIPLAGPAMEEAARDYIRTGKLPPGASRQNIADIAGKAAELRKTENISAPKDLGNPVEVMVDDGKGGKKQVLAQQDKTSGAWLTADEKREKLTGVTGISGKEEVSKDDPDIRSTARAIAEYRQNPITGRTLASAYGKAIMAAVNELNPEYDATQYGERAKAVKDFATGKQGQQLQSFDVAAAHLKTLDRLADELKNGNVPAFNKIANEWSQQVLGKSEVTNFNTAKQVVGAEIIKAVVGAGGGVAEREHASELLNAANTPAQLHSAIETIKEMIGGQLGGLKRTYERTTKLKNFDELLGPSAAEAFAGKDKAKPSADEGASPPASMLTEGKPTVIKNKNTGVTQSWMLTNGVPTLVQAGDTKVP